MRNYTDDELNEISLRNYYQKILGKVLRKYQWENLKFEIELQFPDKKLDKDLLKIIGEIKKKSPNWKVNSLGLKILSEELEQIDVNGTDGASLYILAKKLCSYKVVDRTIKQWFYDVAKTCDLTKNYTKDQVIDVCTKAMTSRPRASR